MDAKERDSKVLEIIAEKLSKNVDELSADKNFIEDLGADSLDTVELVMALEEGFELTIPDEDAESITSVGNVLKYIEEKTA